MRVKIGDKIFDSNEEPIMLIMANDNEREGIINNLSNMEPKEGAQRKYLEAPDTMSQDEMKEFMKID